MRTTTYIMDDDCDLLMHLPTHQKRGRKMNNKRLLLIVRKNSHNRVMLFFSAWKIVLAIAFLANLVISAQVDDYDGDLSFKNDDNNIADIENELFGDNNNNNDNDDFSYFEDHDVPFEGYETVHEYRRRMGIDYGYKPVLINPEICRYEDEVTCEEIDKAMMEQARRNLQQSQTTGRLKVLVLLVRFRNHRNRDVPPEENVEQLVQGGIRDSRTPTGSMKDYIRINSFNRLIIETTFIPWTTVSNTESFCAGDNMGLSADFQQCFWEVLNMLDSRHLDGSDSFNWADFDENGDFLIDSVLVILSGYGADQGGVDPDGAPSNQRIWQHAIGRQIARWRSSVYAIELGTYCVASCFRSFQGGRLARIGVMTHEFLHTMGLIDLYDLSRSGNPGWGVGRYDIMSSPYGQRSIGTYPGHLGAWSRIQVGWSDPIEIRFSGTYWIPAAQSEPVVYIISEPYPEGEYLLIENRQRQHYDALMWTGGLIIWHIDDTLINNSAAGGPYQGDFPENGNHYRVALVQADGNYDLEQRINEGHAEDFYVTGKSLGPGPGFPNTDSYQGGVVRRTGITITDISESGNIMSFRVEGLPAGPPTSPPVSNANSNNNLRFSFSTQQQNNAFNEPTPGCLLSINTELCNNRMKNVVEPIEGCDCYSFCGNDMIGCCVFGETCTIDCSTGRLVTGCTF